MSSKKKNQTPENVEKKAKTTEQTNETVEMTAEEKLKSEIEEKQSQLLSLAAEYDNFRKRSIKERETIFSDAKSVVIKEFFPVLDNLERALSGGETDTENYKKGVEMTFGQLLSTMEKLGIEQFGEVGDTFDPMFYNAVMHIDDDEFGEQAVVEVFQKGFRHGERVLREAMVKVAN